MRHLIILFLAFTSCLQTKGQAPNYKITNYTVDDGLPSNECHGVVQDSLGYIWIATDRGLVKWDGYEFEVWGSDRGLTDMTCIDIYKDKKENLWINTISKGLYILASGSGTVEPYEYNKSILALNDFEQYIEKIAFDENNNLIVHSSKVGAHKISSTGKITRLASSTSKGSIKISNLDNEFFITYNDINNETNGNNAPIELSNKYYNQLKHEGWQGGGANSRAHLLSDTSIQFNSLFVVQTI